MYVVALPWSIKFYKHWAVVREIFSTDTVMLKAWQRKTVMLKAWIKKNNKTQSGHCGVYSRLLGKSLMPFHFSNLQRRIFFSFCVFCNRFWTNRWRIHFGGAPCQGRVRHHFFGSMIFLEMRFFPFLLLRSWRNARRHDSTVFFFGWSKSSCPKG